MGKRQQLAIAIGSGTRWGFGTAVEHKDKEVVREDLSFEFISNCRRDIYMYTHYG